MGSRSPIPQNSTEKSTSSSGILDVVPLDIEDGGTSNGNVPPDAHIEDLAEKTRREIDTVEQILRELEAKRLSINGIDPASSATFVTNLQEDEVFRTHLIRLRNKLNVLEWRAFATHQSLWNLDPVVVDRLLDIQRETATSTGALAALGASLSLSILYSGSRGDMWPFFVAWWLFMISLAVTSALATSSSASSITAATDLLETDRVSPADTLSKATAKNWLLQRFSVFLVFVSLCSMVGGFAALAAAGAAYSVSADLHEGGPHVTGGPDLGSKGIRLAPQIIAYAIIGILGGSMCGAFIYRMRFRLHAKSYTRSFFSTHGGRS